ncbi:MAG: ABC transporter ATP-binding protein [Planctomycetes bacterium]|nr:ABC transporter ATP-binding protein [Planctomycetota bacterium]
MRIFKRYAAYLWRERVWLLFGTLCLIPSSLLNLILPLLLKERVIDNLGKIPVSEFLLGALGIYLALAAGRGVLRFGMRWFLVTSSRRMEANLRNDFFRHLESLSFPYFNKTKTGDLISRATQDIEAIRMFLGPGYMYIVDALVQIPIAIFVLIRVQPVLLLGMGASLAVLAISVKQLTPKLSKHSERVQASIGKLSDKANELFAGTRVIKAFAREENAKEQFDAVSLDYKSHSMRLISVGALSNVFFAGAKDLTLFTLFAIGSVLYMSGRVSVGTLYLFTDYTARLYWPVFVLGWMVSMYPRARAAAIRLNEVFDTKPEIADGPLRDLPEVRGAVEFRNLTFTYDEKRPPVLKDLSFRIEAGQTVAVVGRTSCGKTTLASLLGRFFEVEKGMIFLDGIDINDMTARRLRDALGYVPQDHFLFSDTIVENIAFNANAIDVERAKWAARAACLQTDLSTFPKGIDTEIGERGVTLSGGQRQRVCIARALYKNPKILILDDSLSAVDTSTEDALVRNLKDASRTRTTILIAHRLSTVRHADCIFVIENGRVAEQGNHDSLLQKRGIYHDMWQKQQLERQLETDAAPEPMALP